MLQVTSMAGFKANEPVRFIQGNTTTHYNFGPIVHSDFTLCTISRYTGKSTPPVRGKPWRDDEYKFGNILVGDRDRHW